MNLKIANIIKIKLELALLSSLLSSVTLAQIEAVNRAVLGKTFRHGDMASRRQDEIRLFRGYIAVKIDEVSRPGGWVALEQLGPLGLNRVGMPEEANSRQLFAVLNVLQKLTALMREHGAEDRGPESGRLKQLRMRMAAAPACVA